MNVHKNEPQSRTYLEPHSDIYLDFIVQHGEGESDLPKPSFLNAVVHIGRSIILGRGLVTLNNIYQNAQTKRNISLICNSHKLDTEKSDSPPSLYCSPSPLLFPLSLSLLEVGGCNLTELDSDYINSFLI